jgi:hypothetical protein
MLIDAILYKICIPTQERGNEGIGFDYRQCQAGAWRSESTAVFCTLPGAPASPLAITACHDWQLKGSAHKKAAPVGRPIFIGQKSNQF